MINQETIDFEYERNEFKKAQRKGSPKGSVVLRDYTDEEVERVRTEWNKTMNSLKLKKPCSHEWKLYEGFTERYDYCTLCDEKKT